jgi:transcriptional regulator with XRE-family HTH domain
VRFRDTTIEKNRFAMPLTKHGPHPIDLHVGARVRTRRNVLGWSQTRLADAIGITFQQVQKYERGANRISASKLWEIAKTLKTSIDYFYDGYVMRETPDGFAASDGETAVHKFLMTSEGVELAKAFSRIKSPRQRRNVLALIQSLAEDADNRAA